MAKGILKYIEKDRLYRYMPNNSLDKKVLDKVMHSIGSLTFVGNFYIKGFKTDGYLYELDSYDKELVKNIHLKENEYIFRYTTYNTAIGGMTPLIKINTEKLLAYFGVWEEDEKIKGFTKKGEPIEYLNLIEYYSYSFDDELFMGTKNEMEEHGMNFVDAEKTANDHLKEDKHYYSKMKYVGLAEGGEIALEIDGNYKRIMNDGDFYPFIIINENGEKLGTINLNYRNDLNGYQVSNSNVYKKGQGYGKKAYLLLIKEMDKPIISDSSLTEDAKNLWESLEKSGNAYYDKEKGKFVSIKKMAQGGEVSVEIVNKDKVFDKDTYKGIYGDNDHDGLLNADDPRPNEEGDTESIEQVQLADVFSKLLSTKKDLDKTMYEQVDKLKEISPKGSKIYARTKTPYSILNKLINKRMLDKKDPSKGLTDMVGTTIVAKDFTDINEIKDKIKGGALGKIVDFDDYYSHPKDGYMAYHFIVVDKDTQIPFEVQLKTKRMKMINQASHNAYKYENLDGAKLLKYTRLAQKADEGNVRAQKSFDLLTDDLDALSNSLYKDKTKIKKH
jgi:ppGpp synthetase/RelA/SpoT-type nucleotidyltranferase